ncbi:MAG: hypothetical protein BroJett040_13100 [Oligoflexia bacterium]|nr:MAG: hypothetical protein BroJett040_13100 [Oligoflexia bacterium]
MLFQSHESNGESMAKCPSPFQNAEESLHYENLFDVDPRELHKVLKDVIVIDVRQPEEYKGDGHIPGAKLMVLDTIPARLFELPKDKTIVFVCRSGGRSARAAAYAIENGITNVVNLKGGMLLWSELHLPTEI